LDNTCYVVAPNPANYFLTQESGDALDTFGGKSMIVDYQGKILSEHGYGAGPSYAGAILDIEALRQYRTRSLWGNWLRDLRYPKNLGLEKHPGRHADHDDIRRQVMEMMLAKGIYRRPSKTERQEAPREVAAD